ncbi:hypothetical protein ASPWEDRAFT_144302, partial [Aspergillus wentii DTO 134E9]
MADPPSGGPEPHPTNSQETTASCAGDDLRTRTTSDTANLLNENRKRTRSGDAFTPADPAGRITTKEVWKLIGSLKDIIRHQTAAIEATQNELQEIKHSQHVLQEQNDKLHEELKAVRARVEATPPTTPARSWAEVAAESAQGPPQTPQRAEKEANCVRISTQRTFVDPRDNENADGNTFARYLSTEAAFTHIHTALTKAVTTQDAQVAGVGTTKTGYIVRFKDPESAEIARSNTEWLEDLGNNTKLVKPRFGVVVHRTPTEDLNLETDYNQVIEKITEQNDLAEQGHRIEEVVWLKRADKALGKFASLGIWLDSPEGADHFINRGFVIDKRYIGSVERREIKKKRCFRCQRFGHLAWSCKETPRCGHCAGPHERQRCPPGIRAQCLDCSGEHATGDRQCPSPATPNPNRC